MSDPAATQAPAAQAPPAEDAPVNPVANYPRNPVNMSDPAATRAPPAWEANPRKVEPTRKNRQNMETADAANSVDRGTFFGQFGAIMKKNLIQKSREPVSCLVETLLPVVFVCGLVVIWSVSNVTDVPAANFINPNPALQNVTLLGPAAYGLMCYNDTATTTTIRLPGIRNCSGQEKAMMTFNCLSTMSLAFANYSRLCSMLPMALFLTPFISLDAPRLIPSLTEMILAQSVAVGTLPGNAFQYLSTFQALANAGYLHFVPDNADTRGLAAYFSAISPLFNVVKGNFYNTTAEAFAYTGSLSGAGTTWAVLELKAFTTSDLDLSIHMNRSGITWTNNVRDRFSTGVGSQRTKNYMASGFLTLQQEVQRYYSIAKLGAKYSDLPQSPLISQMPYGGYRRSEFLSVAGQLSPLVIVMAFLYSVSQLTKRIVEEKETRMREAMMIMGLGTGSFYMSWIVTYAIQNTIGALLITIILITTIMAGADFGVIFFTFWLFSITTIFLSGIMGAFFSKSRIAALMAPVVFFLISIPSFALPSTTAGGVYVILSLLSPTAFGVGCKLLFSYQITGGMTAKDIASQYDSPNLAVVFVMMIFDLVIYFLIMLYVDAVMPAEWGTSQHPCYCCVNPVRACNREDERRKQRELDRQNGHHVKTHSTGPDGRDPGGVYESDKRADIEPTVRLSGLRKEFEQEGNKMIAVNDLSFDIYPDEITVILGHNGAGKTTAINMMTGMMDPDGGDCTIYGKSILDDMHGVRQEIGFCPQHNILWPGLTCVEHLDFFAALKGLSGAEKEQAITDMLHAVDLTEKKDTQAGNLSGGQKRKLSIAIAFVGGNRMVFLDEPTAGLDVAARRFTWDLLKRMSVGRTIVLTTHYMDEADLLGSQVAIMAKGRLKCMGSPMFLKSKLGVGYTLTICHEAHVDVDAITSLVTDKVANATELSRAGGEVHLRLPMTSISSFPAALSALEEEGPRRGMHSFGMGVTTLEEIFLKIGHDEVDAQQLLLQHSTSNSSFNAMQPQGDVVPPPPPPAQGSHTPAETEEQPLWDHTELTNTNQDCGVLLSQAWCIIVKRFHNSKRDRRTQCLQIATPIVCVLLAMVLSSLKQGELPPLTLVPSIYTSPLDVVVNGCNSSFTSQFSDTNVYTLTSFTSTPMDRAYDFSTALLKTVQTHPKDRIFSIFCGDTTMYTLPPMGPTNFNVLFTNESMPHSTPLALASWGQAWARAATGMSPPAAGSTTGPNFKITNDPLPMSIAESAFSEAISVLIVGIFIMIPFTFIPSTFVSFIVKERECRAKHLQMISGMNYVVYWASNFIFDMLSFILTAFLAIIIFVIFNRKEYIGTAENVGAIIVLFLFYGLAGVAGSYLVSFLFESHSTAQNITMLANFICGFLLVLVIYFLTLIESTKDAGKALRWIFRIVPSYALGEGILNLASRNLFEAFGVYTSAFSLDVIGYDLIYMGCAVPVYLALTLVIDHPSHAFKGALFSETKPEALENEDDDVAKEREEVERSLDELKERDGEPRSPEEKQQKQVAVNVTEQRRSPRGAAGTSAEEGSVAEMKAVEEGAQPAAEAPVVAQPVVDRTETDVILVRNLRKVYTTPRGDKVAVKNLTFGVHRGEVFGFLGTNGAGKTTTISILCGEHLPSAGHCTIGGKDVMTDALATRQMIGYCPQFDALLDLLTVEEHLYLYGGLRGLTADAKQRVTERLIAACDLQDHREKQSMTLSGGNKRKLSLALSLLGGPQVVFLDEPSAGMDPQARRTMWDVIQRVAKQSSVVLTTHHLEEVEALATRVSIMVDGEMKCIGPLQRLKTKFGSGFEMSVRVAAQEYVDPLVGFVSGQMPSSTMLESRNRKVTFSLPVDTKLSAVFSMLEANKLSLKIEDYAVSQTSLDQVFLRICETAEPPEE